MTAAGIFVQAGYCGIANLRQMQESARAFFVASLRKMAGKKTSAIGVRLVLGPLGVSHTEMKNAKDPRIEEIEIPTQMKKWSPSMTNLAGYLTPDQDMVNFFTVELTRGEMEAPPYTPFVTGGLAAAPWMPNEPIFDRAHESWKKLQLTHKRPTNQQLSFQAFALNYLRFTLAGDLAGAW